jgi:hypothetical protein
MKVRKVLTAITVATILGLLGLTLGSLVGARQVVAAEACENNACNTTSGNCVATDIPANCKETLPSGCQSTAC